MKDIKFCVRIKDYFIEYCNMIMETDETPMYKLRYIKQMYEHKFTSGVFNPDLDKILINLGFHGLAYKDLGWDEEKLIKYICGTIIHETLHCAFYEAGCSGYSNKNEEELIHELQEM